MNKLLRFSLLFCVIFSLTGCKTLNSVRVQGPPVYKDGVPQDLHYEKLALRTQEMAKEGEIPSDPKEAYLLAEQKIKELGVQIIPKAPTGFEQWDQFTTAFPSAILVKPGWEERSYASRAPTMWHELVHLRQYKKHGELLMGLMYFTAEGRWAMEVQAYRETFNVLRIFGTPEDQIRASMERRAVRLYEAYQLGAMPRDYAINRAIEIWMLDSPNP